MRQIDDYPLEVLLTLALAFGGYQLSVWLHVSAPIMAVCAGLLIGDIGSKHGMSEETRHYARYVWCTVLDELVNKSAWGGGVWSKQSLLSQFHGETGGGERFFQLLSFLQEYPAKNLHLLELMYVCLGLGFEGKYSLDSRGYAQLESLRDNLFHLIRMQKGEPERDLSPHWQRVTKRRNPLARYLPLWVVVAVVGVIMLATFSGFSYLLSERTSAIVAQLESLQDTEQGQ